MVSTNSRPFRLLVADFTSLDAFPYEGKASLHSTSISMSMSSVSTVVQVSTTIFSFTKTFSFIPSWLVLLIITCLNLQWASRMFNTLRDWKIDHIKYTYEPCCEQVNLWDINFFMKNANDKNDRKIHFNSPV